MAHKSSDPQRWAEYLLSKLRPQGDADIVLGDLEEEFHYLLEIHGLRKARAWYRRQALSSLPIFTKALIYWSFVMFLNYLKIMLRNLQRHRIYSFINIGGLAVGLTVSLLILLYVKDELSYDRYHEYADRIYRVAYDGSFQGRGIKIATTEAPLATTLLAEYPEVENAVRFRQIGPALIGYGNERFYEDNFVYADSTVFDIFSFPLVYGNAKAALTEPYTMVITTEMAEKYFGRRNVIGETLRWNNRNDYKITGVMTSIPSNSHFRFDFLGSMESLEDTRSQVWGGKSYATYALLGEGRDPEALQAKFPALMRKYKGAWVERMLGMPYDQAIAEGMRRTYFLQPLTSIYLHSDLEYEIAPMSSIDYVYVLSAIALFILMIASINFMNLATARSANRAREVGMRKVMGSLRSQLVKQFMGESLFMSFLAGGLALLLVYFVLPTYANLVGKDLALSGHVISVMVIAAVVGVASGVYPALVLSSFEPQEVLKRAMSLGRNGSRLRGALVVVQFTISIGLIICTAIMSKQLAFMQNQRLGFEQEHVVVLPIETQSARQRYDAFRNQLLEHPGVLNVGAASTLPGRFYNDRPYRLEGAGDVHDLKLWSISYDLIETLDMKMISGRPPSRQFQADQANGIILNEAAVRRFGETPESAVGKTMVQIGLPRDDGDMSRTIVGVVKDFHYESLHQTIGPVVMTVNPDRFLRLLVRIRPENISETLAFLQARWREHEPGYPYNYFFLDDDFGRLYDREQRLSEIYGYFTGLAMFISCLGLFGLASFMASQRTREIGIRKVLGASSRNIVGLLSKEFTRLVLLACCVAFPAAYFLMAGWLQGFAYQTAIGVDVFVGAGLAALVVAWLTVGYQCLKAAFANPADSLRFE